MTAGKTIHPRSSEAVSYADIVQRIRDGERIRRRLSTWGRIQFDRPLPFIYVYRHPKHRSDVGTRRFLQGESACIVESNTQAAAPPATGRLTQELIPVLAGRFGGVLLLELWADPGIGVDTIAVIDGQQPDPLQPVFQIVTPTEPDEPSVSRQLRKALERVRVQRRTAVVQLKTVAKVAPPGLSPLLGPRKAQQLNCFHVGLAVRPIYQGPEHEQLLPLVFRALRPAVTTALRRAAFAFCQARTSYNPANYLAVGPRGVPKSVWVVDRRLAELAESLDFLLQVTPVNARDCWARFHRDDFKVAPRFLYRGLPVDPALVKRRLYDIRIEAVSDATFDTIFREQRGALDRKLTMLTDLNTKRFLYGSLQLYGGISPTLARVAEDLLVLIPPRSREERAATSVAPDVFADRVRARLVEMRAQVPEVNTRVDVRQDIGGMMVSQGNLYIARSMKIPAARADALFVHEVETHVLTYYNGAAQRFQQLRHGLAGYDELQEGLAVLAEYLVGGLSRPRLRLLGARVLAAKAMVDGATFIEVFRELVKFGFGQQEAFTITMRIFRGGGLTKDAVYLRGLVRILKDLPRINDIDILFSGKFSLEHLPLVEEMRWRKLVTPPRVRPLYLDQPAAKDRLAQLKKGMSVTDLLVR